MNLAIYEAKRRGRKKLEEGEARRGAQPAPDEPEPGVEYEGGKD